MSESPKKSTFREYAESLIIAVALALVIRTVFFAPFKIPSGSMRPTLMEGDRILVNKIIYGVRIPFTTIRVIPPFRQPRRGDLVVFRSPDNDRDFIKRLVALEGDQVEIKDLRLWINGKPLTDPSVFRELSYFNRGDFGKNGSPITIPPGHYFFLGDNTGSSRDSRYFGPLPKSHLIGRAFLIVWPPQRIRWFK